MLSSLSLDSALRYLELGMRLLLLALLWRRSLLRRYNFFSIFLGGSSLRALGFLFIPYTTILYARVWSVTQPLLWILQIMAVLEIMQLVFEAYPKIGNAAKTITMTSFSFGIAIGLVLAVIDFGTAAMPWWLESVWMITKSVSWATAFILVGQMLWFVIFPVPMVRAVAYHRLLFALYSGVLPGLAYLTAGLGDRRVNAIVNDIFLSVSSVLLLLWCVLLRPVNEYCLLGPAKRKSILFWLTGLAFCAGTASDISVTDAG